MSLKESLEKKKFDKRLMDFNLKNNVIREEDLEAQKKSLPDLADRVLAMSLEDDEADESDYQYS